MDLQERQPHAFREYGTAPHQGESAGHHPERHPAQPHRVDEIEEFLVGQTLGPDEDDATGLRAVQHFPYRREVSAIPASEVDLTGQGVGSGHVLHHPAQPRPAFVISDQKNRSLSETAAVDPTYGALVEEPERAGAQQAEYGGRQYLPEPEAALGVDRRPYSHQPGPAERGPEESSGAAPYGRPVVEAESGEERDPGREQQRREADGRIRPAAPGGHSQPDSESESVREHEDEDARRAPQQLEAKEPLQNVSQDPHGVLRARSIPPRKAGPAPAECVRLRVR